MRSLDLRGHARALGSKARPKTCGSPQSLSRLTKVHATPASERSAQSPCRKHSPSSQSQSSLTRQSRTSKGVLSRASAVSLRQMEPSKSCASFVDLQTTSSALLLTRTRTLMMKSASSAPISSPPSASFCEHQRSMPCASARPPLQYSSLGNGRAQASSRGSAPKTVGEKTEPSAEDGRARERHRSHSP